VLSEFLGEAFLSKNTLRWKLRRMQPVDYARALHRLLPVSLLLALMLASLLQPANAADPVTLVVGGKKVAFLVSPFVGDDGQVYSPVDLVRVLGGDFKPNPGQTTVTVTPASGPSFTLPYIAVKGRFCVSVDAMGKALGATVIWSPARKTMELRARIKQVRVTGGVLEVATSYPIYFHRLDSRDPNEIDVDFYGLDSTAGVTDLKALGEDVRSAQWINPDPSTSRLILHVGQAGMGRIDTSTPSNRIRIAVAPAGLTAPPNQNSEQAEEDKSPNGDQAEIPARPSGPLEITGVTVSVVSESLTQVIVQATAPAVFRTISLTGPDRLALDLTGAALNPAVKNVSVPQNKVVRNIRSGTLSEGATQFGRIVVDLARATDFSVTTQMGPEGATYLINLRTGVARMPVSSAGLNGKIIMIDPGHGGMDSGAVGVGGLLEKDLALAIATKLRDVLQSNGAIVYMTRHDDTFIPLAERPRLGIAAHADYFISVHCDSAGTVNAHSGTTIYYHANNPVCRRLAQDIGGRVGETSGIPPLGTKSDTIRFQTGFAVLRGSPMPAVLVECGYVNCEADLAKLADAACQSRIANGIAAGLIDFNAEAGAR